MSQSQPVISVDPVALSVVGDQLRVVLVERQYEPFAGRLALPGVMLLAGETSDEAAVRGLRYKAGIESHEIHALFAGRYHDETNRDPRGATISLTQIAIVSQERGEYVRTMGELPFGQNAIVTDAISDVSSRIWKDPSLFPAFLGEHFTTPQAQALLVALGIEAGDNLPRQLARSYERIGTARIGKRGRPAARWSLPRHHGA